MEAAENAKSGIDKQQVNHILNPHKNLESVGSISSFVVADSALEADVLAITVCVIHDFFGAGEERGGSKGELKYGLGCDLENDLEGRLKTDLKGTVDLDDGFKKQIKNLRKNFDFGYKLIPTD